MAFEVASFGVALCNAREARVARLQTLIIGGIRVQAFLDDGIERRRPTPAWCGSTTEGGRFSLPYSLGLDLCFGASNDLCFGESGCSQFVSLITNQGTTFMKQIRRTADAGSLVEKMCLRDRAQNRIRKEEAIQNQ